MIFLPDTTPAERTSPSALQIAKFPGIRRLSLLFAVGALILGCEPSSPPAATSAAASAFLQTLPIHGDAFHLLLDDFDRSGALDLSVVSHGGNFLQFFHQRAPRQFTAGAPITTVGYHPGDLLRLPGDQPMWLLLGEGAGQLVTFEISAERQWLPRSQRGETAPRHGALFRWPGWGLGLAVVPFQQDYLVLYKNIDPVKLGAAERIVVPLDSVRPSLRNAERLSVADIDGDGVDEILFATVNTNEVAMIQAPAKGKPPQIEILARFAAGRPWNLAVADLNKDGHLDLVVPNQTEPVRVHLVINDGKGRFTQRVKLDYPAEWGIRRVAAARDRDGFLYLLGAAYENLTLYQVPRHWDGELPIPQRTLPFSRSSTALDLQLLDIDGDGVLDALLGEAGAVQILYGPLWPQFDAMNGKPLILN